ncbi:hypothetical protein ACR3K2_39440 [Cryptosporidium serpentis]
MDTSKVLEKLEETKLGIRSIIYSKEFKTCNLRKVTALLYGILEKKNIILDILYKSNLLNFKKNKYFVKKNSKVTNKWLLVVMTYDLLYGIKKLQGGGTITRLLRINEEKIRNILETDYPESLINKCEELPRYLRINTSITNSNTVLNTIKLQIKNNLTNIKINEINKLIWIDKEIPNIIVCNPNIAKKLELDRIPSKNELINGCHVTLQDKGSCISVIASGIKPGDIIIDACSAPGSKTIQIIDTLYRNGYLVSFDHNFSRIKIMISRIYEIPYLSGPYLHISENNFKLINIFSLDKDSLEKGCLFFSKDEIFIDGDEININIKKQPRMVIYIVLKNFLNIQYTKENLNIAWYDYLWCVCRAKFIILDPSCSGSGLPLHKDIIQKDISHRLLKLTIFQKKMLLHAMNNFINVNTICYSTCSIYKEENEDVVIYALNKSKDSFKLVNGIDWWEKKDLNLRYEDIENICDLFLQCKAYCIKMDPKIHKCRGFFLAKLLRGNSNKYL